MHLVSQIRMEDMHPSIAIQQFKGSLLTTEINGECGVVVLAPNVGNEECY